MLDEEHLLTSARNEKLWGQSVKTLHVLEMGHRQYKISPNPRELPTAAAVDVSGEAERLSPGSRNICYEQ